MVGMSKASRRAARRGRTVPARGGRASAPRRPSRALLLAGAAAIAVIAVIAVVLVRPGGSSSAVAWSRLGTEDVHSLSFVADDPNRLLFGHHGGLSSSSDGGRTWQQLPTRSDAMSLGAASDGSIVIAGHDVLAASRDGGQTWENIAAKLPTLDIHGFARDPAEPARMWAYLATGGLWESNDGGLAWERIQQENVLSPVAANSSGGTRLFGVTADGLVRSDDRGRAWRTVGNPEIYPIASLTATTDGSVILAGGPGGLARSNDGGATWSKLPFDGQPAAIAVTAGGRTIGIVARSTEFFRSDDGGQTWVGP